MRVFRKRKVLASTAVVLVAAAVCAAAAVTATASTKSSTRATGTVTVSVVSNFTSDIARGQALDALMKQFNATHPGIKVVSQTTADWPTLQAKIRTQIAVGKPPDVFLYNFNPSDLSLEKYGSKKLIDWTPYFKSDPSWASRFPQEDLKMLKFGGDTAAVPDDQSSAVVFYRKDLFAKAGITSFPTTWTQFWADAQTLKSAGITPVTLFTADDAWYAMNALSYFALSAGGPNAYYATHLKAAPLVQAATNLQKLFTFAPSNAVGANYAVGSAAFLNGQAAMVIDGPWLISSIQKDVPSFCTNVGVATAPTNGNGVEKPGTIVTDALTVWGAAKQSDQAKQKAVVQWMKFFTSPQSAATMASAGQFPLIVKTPTSGKAFKTANCLVKQLVKLSNAAPQKAVNIERYMTPAAQAKLPSLLESLVTGGSSPAKFVATLQNLNR